MCAIARVGSRLLSEFPKPSQPKNLTVERQRRTRTMTKIISNYTEARYEPWGVLLKGEANINPHERQRKKIRSGHWDWRADRRNSPTAQLNEAGGRRLQSQRLRPFSGPVAQRRR